MKCPGTRASTGAPSLRRAGFLSIERRPIERPVLFLFLRERE
jgi:hypothetical protein